MSDHKLTCSLFAGEDFCDCGQLDVAELVNFHAERATEKRDRAA